MAGAKMLVLTFPATWHGFKRDTTLALDIESRQLTISSTKGPSEPDDAMDWTFTCDTGNRIQQWYSIKRHPTEGTGDYSVKVQFADVQYTFEVPADCLCFVRQILEYGKTFFIFNAAKCY